MEHNIDPNRILDDIRAITNDDDESFRADMASQLEALIGTLDDWLSGGGELPVAWRGD